MASGPVTGAGFGLRRAHLGPLAELEEQVADFLEVAPENWIGIGGRMGRQFGQIAERYPLICHGLSLSIGGPTPIDETFLHRLKKFFREHRVVFYSEHLSYSSDEGHLYDLLPIPFTDEAVQYVAARVRQVQDLLEQRIALENVSYYAAPGQQMEEADFINAVLETADCDLLLDINNVYVNSVNHGYDPLEFLRRMPGDRIAYFHLAGHFVETPELVIDTHGADVVEPVWNLLEAAYAHFGVAPTLLERDFNIPPLAQLRLERDRIADLQHRHHPSRLGLVTAIRTAALPPLTQQSAL